MYSIEQVGRMLGYLDDVNLEDRVEGVDQTLANYTNYYGDARDGDLVYSTGNVPNMKQPWKYATQQLSQIVHQYEEQGLQQEYSEWKDLKHKYTYLIAHMGTMEYSGTHYGNGDQFSYTFNSSSRKKTPTSDASPEYDNLKGKIPSVYNVYNALYWETLNYCYGGGKTLTGGNNSTEEGHWAKDKMLPKDYYEGYALRGSETAPDITKLQGIMLNILFPDPITGQPLPAKGSDINFRVNDKYQNIGSTFRNRRWWSRKMQVGSSDNGLEHFPKQTILKWQEPYFNNSEWYDTSVDPYSEDASTVATKYGVSVGTFDKLTWTKTSDYGNAATYTDKQQPGRGISKVSSDIVAETGFPADAADGSAYYGDGPTVVALQNANRDLYVTLTESLNGVATTSVKNTREVGGGVAGGVYQINSELFLYPGSYTQYSLMLAKSTKDNEGIKKVGYPVKYTNKKKDEGKGKQSDSGSGGGGSCFLGDTPVRMADGTNKRIDEIKIGDIVQTYNGPQPVMEIGYEWRNDIVNYRGVFMDRDQPVVVNDRFCAVNAYNNPTNMNCCLPLTEDFVPADIGLVKVFTILPKASATFYAVNPDGELIEAAGCPWTFFTHAITHTNKQIQSIVMHPVKIKKKNIFLRVYNTLRYMLPWMKSNYKISLIQQSLLKMQKE